MNRPLGTPFNVLIMRGDGRRVVRLRIPSRTTCLGLTLLVVGIPVLGLALLGPLTALPPAHRAGFLGAIIAPTMDHGPRASTSAFRPGPDDEQALIALVRQRLPEIQAEMTKWREVHGRIRKQWRPRRVAPPDHSLLAADGETPRPTDQDLTALSRQIDHLLETVRNEDRNLRALERYITQVDGVLAALPSRWPIRAKVTSEYGMRPAPSSGAREFHGGLDIEANVGTPVIAPSPASVTFVGAKSDYGRMVILDHGNGVTTRFGHLQKTSVAVGQRVDRGESIGYSGNTGRTTGPHLHYEVLVHGRRVNPRAFAWE